MKTNLLTSSPLPRLIRIHLFLFFWVNNAFSLIRACYAGFWLGIFDRPALLRLGRHFYDVEPMYFEQEFNRAGLFFWEQRALDRYFKGCRSLLVAGAGGGREVLALRRQGFDADGFECNPLLLERGNQLLAQEGLPPDMRLADPNACPDLGKTYDGLIIGWAVYTLIQPGPDRIVFLRKLRSLVPGEAPILLSFFTHPGRGLRFRIIRLIANVLRMLRRRPPVDLGDDLVPLPVHYFTQEEIAAELEETGFRLKYYSSWMSAHAVGLAHGD